MLANINEVYNFSLGLITNKEQSGEISPDQFNLAINVAQQQYFKVKLGIPELYSVEKREAPQQFQASQSISDSLRKFIVSATLTKSGNGFNLPPNFAAWGDNDYLEVQLIDGQNVAVNQSIEFVTIGERGFRLNNYIKPPSYQYPIVTYLDNQLVVDPAGITGIKLSYVRYPTTPVRAYTVVNDFNIYDPANSTQLEFPNLDWEDIAHIAIDYWSTNLREEFLKQSEQSRIKTGQ